MHDQASHGAPGETEDDVPVQAVPSALQRDPGQPAGQHSDDDRRAEHFDMHDWPSLTHLTECSGPALAISLDVVEISRYKLYIK